LRDIWVVRRRDVGLRSPFRVDTSDDGPPVAVEWTWRHEPGHRWMFGGITMWLLAMSGAMAVGLGWHATLAGWCGVLGLIFVGDVVGALGSASRYGTAVLELGGPALVVRGLPGADPLPMLKEHVARVDVRHDASRAMYEVRVLDGGGQGVVLGSFADRTRAAYLRAVIDEAMQH
jgi:hypothetical protein